MNQTITNDAGDTLGTIEHLNNDGYTVYAPTSAHGQYGGAFPTLREATRWLEDEQYRARG